MTTIDSEKVERCKQKLLEGYFSNSIIESTLTLTDFSQELHHGFDFQKFGVWLYVPKDWFTDPSNYPDFAFSEFGRGIARGEEKYLIEQILDTKKMEIEKTNQFSYDYLLNAAKLLTLKSHQRKLTVFLPIEYYKSLIIDWGLREGKVRMEADHFHADAFEFKLFWSNKFIGFDKIVIATKTFGRWIAKPSVRNRLAVDLAESREKTDQMELKAETKFNFRIENPDEIRVLSAPIPTNPK
jgi:hypothetical protein